MAYGQTKKDYNYLDSLIEVGDTISFAADEVFDLMENPTKARAESMYVAGINVWFEENPDIAATNRRVEAIRDRHNIHPYQ